MNKDNQKKILVVDDEETFLYATADLLKLTGYYSDTANNAIDALKLIQETHYDLLISDIKMPGNFDLNFIREAKNINGRLSVILITGYPEIKTAIESVNLSIGAYLVKPLEFNDLHFHIKRVLVKENINLNI
jgi:two-component system response regulator HydG